MLATVVECKSWRARLGLLKVLGLESIVHALLNHCTKQTTSTHDGDGSVRSCSNSTATAAPSPSCMAYGRWQNPDCQPCTRHKTQHTTKQKCEMSNSTTNDAPPPPPNPPYCTVHVVCRLVFRLLPGLASPCTCYETHTAASDCRCSQAAAAH